MPSIKVFGLPVREIKIEFVCFRHYALGFCREWPLRRFDELWAEAEADESPYHSAKMKDDLTGTIKVNFAILEREVMPFCAAGRRLGIHIDQEVTLALVEIYHANRKTLQEQFNLSLKFRGICSPTYR